MHRHTQSPSHAGACRVANGEYRGGVRRQNGRLGRAPASNWEAPAPALSHGAEPVVCSLAREKVNSHNVHPDMIAQTDKINEGSKRNLAEQKADLVGMLRKRQREVGRFEAMKYFTQDDNKRLAWSAPLFNDAKDGASNADGIKHSCHLEKELASTKL